MANETNFHAPVQVLAKVRPPQYITKLDDKQHCGNCRGELMLLDKQQLLLCKSCGSTISVMANTPLLETTQGLRPFGTQIPNEDDGVFMVGLSSDDDDRDDNDGNEVLYSSSDRRIMRIKLKRGQQNITEKEISRLD